MDILIDLTKEMCGNVCVCWMFLMYSSLFLCLELKSIKVEESSPQHPSMKKDRENVEINDYEEEGDLEEEEVRSGERKKRNKSWVELLF